MQRYRLTLVLFIRIRHELPFLCFSDKGYGYQSDDDSQSTLDNMDGQNLDNGVGIYNKLHAQTD